MPTRRRFAVTGSTGMIGEALVRFLEARGDEVVRVVRSREAARDGAIYWSPARQEVDAQRFEGLDGVVHLAGAPIGPGSFTARARREIMESRSKGTGLLATTLSQLDDPPPVLVSQSGINWYGFDRGDEVLTEDAPGPGDGFLARVVEVWEDSTGAAQEDERIRVAITRTGLVLSASGGFLPLLSLPFKLFVGGRLGDGSQWMSWVSLEDEIRAFAFLLDRDHQGIFNVTGPVPVRNSEFTEALASSLGRPAWLPVPKLLPPGPLGDLLEETAFVNLRVVPARLEEAGFEFRHRDLRSALDEVL